MYAINPELCTFCKKCMEECPSGAITEGSVDGKEVCVVNADCIDCGGCEDACETGGRFGTLVFYREKVEPCFFPQEALESGAFWGRERAGFG